jgi:hypothetical protein
VIKYLLNIFIRSIRRGMISEERSTRPIVLRVSKDTHRYLKALSVSRDITMNRIATDIIERHIEFIKKEDDPIYKALITMST